MRLTRCIKRLLLLSLVLGILAHLVWLYNRNLHADQESYQREHFYHLPVETVNKTQAAKSVFKVNKMPILLWWDSVYTDVDEIRECGNYRCRLTNKRELQNNHDTMVFLFYGSNFKPYNLPFPRKEHHLWALMHEESPRNAYIFSHEPSLTLFNFTSTFSMQSDYPITTQWLQCPDWLQDTKYVLALVDKNRLRKLGLAPILYLQSDCDVPSDRDSYVKLLQQYIKVDSYGTCLHNKNMAKKLRFQDNMAPLDDQEFFRFASRYKFTLAMENYVCDDYITEKLWRPLRLGSVPIVFGAPNVRDYLPSNDSAIIVEDFPDVEDLAQYIDLLDSHDKLYKEHLKFKDEPITNIKLKELLRARDWLPDFCRNNHVRHKNDNVRKHSSIFTGFECFVCENAHKYLETGGRIRFTSNSSTLGCPSPRCFDEHGQYSIQKDAWSSEWNYGKYEAIAMYDLYLKNKHMTRKEFSNHVKFIIDDYNSG